MRRLLFLSAILFSSLTAAEIHVAVNGNDANNGSQTAPLATLEHAQVLARKTPNATVIIHQGTYSLQKPLQFTADDSNTTWTGAANETVIISGGKQITGWVTREAGIWQIDIPTADDWYFRELFVNGQRAVRARWPNVTAKSYAIEVKDFSLSDDVKSEMLSVDAKHAKEWNNLTDVEIVVFKNWASYHKRIQSVDVKTGRFTMMPPHVKYTGSNRPRRGTYCFFENAHEFLDEPGEWYFDRKTKSLYYMPRAGEKMETATVMAPVIPHVVLMNGTAVQPIKNLVFKQLTFAHNRYDLPEFGHHGRQASFMYGGGGLPAMVQGEYVQDSSFIGCTFAHSGSNGIELQAGCRGNQLIGNHVYDIAGNGIGVGHKNDEATIPEKNRISNNYVHHCGAVFLGACGIWSGFVRDIHIDHNLVTDLPYTGISVGWVWGPQESLVRNNIIEWNHIHNVMREVGDGGGIYTLGWQPGTILRCNHIYDVKRGPYAHAAPNNGIFFDEGSKGYLVERNLIYNTAGKEIRHNRCDPKWLTWKDNVFGKKPDALKLAPGRLGKALAAGHVMIKHRKELESEKFTLMAWINPKNVKEEDQRFWIASKNKNVWEESFFCLLLVNDKPTAYLNIGGGKENNNVLAAKTERCAADTWSHLAMSYDGKLMKLFVNGKEVAAKEINKTRKPGRGDFAIARRADGHGIDFPGLIDDVRLYQTALTADHIALIAAKPEEDPDSKNLADRWEFEQAGGQNGELAEVAANAGLEGVWKSLQK